MLEDIEILFQLFLNKLGFLALSSFKKKLDYINALVY